MFSLLNNVGSPDSLLKPPKIMGRSPRLNACSSSWRRSGRRRSAELLGCKANARGSKSLQPRCGLLCNMRAMKLGRVRKAACGATLQQDVD